MSFYTTDEKTINKLELQLKAEELNNFREQQLLQFLADFGRDYGTKQFNKRFETALNAALADKYGTHPIERYDGVTEWNNVYVGLSKIEWSSDGGYSLRIYFEGHECRYDYDTKKYLLGTKRKTLELYNVKDAIQVAIQARNIETARIESNVKIQANQRNLKRLIAKRNKLVLQVNEFNDLVSYAVADELRIK